MNNKTTEELIFFLKQCCDAILQHTEDEVIKHGTNLFNQRLEQSTVKSFSSTQLPVQSELNKIEKTPFTFNFHDIASQLKWRPSPRTDYDAEVIALCSFNEMLNLGDLVAGLMFMTPDQIYPEHGHPPQEVYFVLSGNASWLYGGNEHYKQLKPGDLAYNYSQNLHGMKTKEESLLALYFLWGDKAQSYNY